MPPNKKWHVLGKYQVDRMVNGSYHRIYSPSEWGGMLEMALVNSWVDSTGDVYMQYSRCLDHDLDGVLVRGIKPSAIVTFTLYVCKRLCFVCYILECYIYSSQLGNTRWFQLLGIVRSLGLVWFVWFHAPRF